MNLKSTALSPRLQYQTFPNNSLNYIHNLFNSNSHYLDKRSCEFWIVDALDMSPHAGKKCKFMNFKNEFSVTFGTFSVTFGPFSVTFRTFGSPKSDPKVRNSNRPYLEILMSSGANSFTNRKLRVRAFDWCYFHPSWTSISRDMGDSSLVSEIEIQKW